jgi:hypothetical protein
MPARNKTVALPSAPRNKPQSVEDLEDAARGQFENLVSFVKAPLEKGATFLSVEAALVPKVLRLGALLLSLFLAVVQARLTLPKNLMRNKRRFRKSQSQVREIGTYFGPVRYWRTFMRSSKGPGFYPLDEALSMPVQGFSLHLVSLASRITTKVSFEQTQLILELFLGWSPSKTSVERMILGLGKSTSDWSKKAPPPEGDGEVLVMMFDSKASPTATEEELEKRRKPHRKDNPDSSRRHRSRGLRKHRGKKARRKKGDKSKNGRAATIVVIYTLKKGKDKNGNPRLEGPVNKRVYASFAKKRHAFEFARREADRRGFGKGSDKTIQIVVDGENNFEKYTREFFPEAILTLDIFHAMEYLWSAGRSLYKEGSEALSNWVKKQKDRLLNGKLEDVLKELTNRLKMLPKNGPGTKGKRTRVEKSLGYLKKRVAILNYKEMLEKDLEISSGPVEGAVRNVIAQRFDCAGMRWIPERSEALLQLRCIEINGQWDAYVKFVERAAQGKLSVMSSVPKALPTLEKTPPARRKAA